MRHLILTVLFFFVGPSPAFSSFDLDIDDDGQTVALTDGLLVLRYMFGLTDDALTFGVIGDNAEREDSDKILMYLVSHNESLDIDGNGSVDALTDGLLILRELFGLSDSALVTGVISNNATRTTSSSVIVYISTIKDSDGDDVVDANDIYPNDPLRTKFDVWGLGDWKSTGWSAKSADIVWNKTSWSY